MTQNPIANQGATITEIPFNFRNFNFIPLPTVAAATALLSGTVVARERRRTEELQEVAGLRDVN